jgi:hypothetical protein
MGLKLHNRAYTQVLKIQSNKCDDKIQTLEWLELNPIR